MNMSDNAEVGTVPASSTGKILKHRLSDAVHDPARRRRDDIT
jgi:hypothetical protein